MPLPPQNLDAEERLLGALLLAGSFGPAESRSVLDRVLSTGLVVEDFFHRERNGVIFDAIVSVVERGESCEILFVEKELAKRPLLESVGGASRIRELVILSTSTANARHFAELVVEAAQRRYEMELGQALVQAAANGGLQEAPELRSRLNQFVSAPLGDPRCGMQFLNFRSVTEALGEARPETPWVVDGYLAEGSLTVIAGRPKVGKTTLVFALIRELSSAAPYFLGRRLHGTGVLFLTEERQATFAAKARRFRLGANVHVLYAHEMGSETWPGIVAQARAYCCEHDLGVLVVDTFPVWARLRGDEENSAGFVREALSPLADAAASRLAVLLLAHQRKASGDFGSAVRGSNGLTGEVDVLVEIERSGSGEGLRILRALSRFDETPTQMAIKLSGDCFESVGSDLSSVRVAEECERVRLALKTRGASTAAELAAEIGIPEGTVRKRLDELGAAVDREGRGVKNDPVRYWLAQVSIPHKSSPIDTESNLSSAIAPSQPLSGAASLVRKLFGDGLTLSEIVSFTRLPSELVKQLAAEHENGAKAAAI
jgi:hypothetical protein